MCICIHVYEVFSFHMFIGLLDMLNMCVEKSDDDVYVSIQYGTDNQY